MASCGEHGTSQLMLGAENLTDDFCRLQNGLAGKILLKYNNYRLKVAAVLTPELVNQCRFRQMALETNRGNQFRIFYDRSSAEHWLVG